MAPPLYPIIFLLKKNLEVKMDLTQLFCDVDVFVKALCRFFLKRVLSKLEISKKLKDLIEITPTIQRSKQYLICMTYAATEIC